MLRVAIPNKGTLSETATQMLSQAGYAIRRDSRELYVADPVNGVDFFYLRPRDIATYVGSGALDVGITGRDLLLDSGSDASEVASLAFGESTFRFAGPAGTFTELEEIVGLRIATSYSHLIRTYLKEHGIACEIIHLDGAVESAIRLGVADVIADVVSTGTTLRNAGLEIFGPTILESSAVLIGSPEATRSGSLEASAKTLAHRLRGVMLARQYVLVDYDAPAHLLDELSKITPGIESPTVSPLADPDWVAVRAMMPRKGINEVMDRLYAAGARAILVSSILTTRM